MTETEAVSSKDQAAESENATLEESEKTEEPADGAAEHDVPTAASGENKAKTKGQAHDEAKLHDKNAKDAKNDQQETAPHGTSEGKPSPVARLKAILGGLKPALGRGVKELKRTPEHFRAAGKNLMNVVLGFPRLLIHGDLMTRVLALGLVASVALVTMTGVQLLRRFGPQNPPLNAAPAHEPTPEEKRLEGERNLKIQSANIVFLDRFSANLVSKLEKEKLFELEFYVETNSPEAAKQLRGHMAPLRELVSQALQGQTYDDLLTEEGKARLKKNLLAAINKGLQSWLPEASAKRIFFTRFVMN